MHLYADQTFSCNWDLTSWAECANVDVEVGEGGKHTLADQMLKRSSGGAGEIALNLLMMDGARFWRCRANLEAMARGWAAKVDRG